MENLKVESENPQLESSLEEQWAEEVTDRQKNVVNDDSTLKRVLKHLSKQKKKKKKKKRKKTTTTNNRLLLNKSCSSGYFADFKVDRQVKLKCRQLPNVVGELRRAVMRQDWDEATTLLMILCHPGLKYYSTIIIKVCFILLLSHPNSSFTLLQNFIRLTTEYILEEDVNKFIRILFALRKTPLEPLQSGRYIRKTGDYKVVRDPEYDKL